MFADLSIIITILNDRKGLNMEKILELAKQLGQEIASTLIAQQYFDASKKLDEDKDAQDLIKQYEQQAQQLAMKERQAQPIEPQEKQKLSDLQTKIAENPTIKQWMQAQVEYVNLLRKVNEAVMAQMPNQQKTQAQ